MNLFLLPTLVAGFCLIPTGQVTAQTFTNLHSFTLNGSDGANPEAGLIISGNTLFGTTEGGGGQQGGTVFAVNTDGTGFKPLWNFALGYSAGSNPHAGLILSDAALYGTAEGGGNSGAGTLFAVNTNDTGLSIVHTFTNFPASITDGANPFAGLLLSAGTLFGTTADGGTNGYGTVFAFNANFTNLHSFAATSGASFTNGDGANPQAGLILSGTTLFGTTPMGGTSGNGTVFAVNTDGTHFTNLYNFSSLLLNTNSDGANPEAGLVLSGNILYGTAVDGVLNGNGTIFAIGTNGIGFTNIYTFTPTTGAPATNNDGANPEAGLVLSGNTLYGTALHGGRAGDGTVFAVNTDGTGFTNLRSFTALISNTNGDGANPFGELLLSGNTLYGTTVNGGTNGFGTLFSLTLPPPQMTIIQSSTNVILTWPTYAPEITLQSTTNLLPPAVWNTNLPSPVLVGGMNTVTNPISGQANFFRLSQ